MTMLMITEEDLADELLMHWKIAHAPTLAGPDEPVCGCDLAEHEDWDKHVFDAVVDRAGRFRFRLVTEPTRYGTVKIIGRKPKSDKYEGIIDGVIAHGFFYEHELLPLVDGGELK